MLVKKIALLHPAYIFLFYVISCVLPSSIEISGVERDISTIILFTVMICIFGWMVLMSKFVSELSGKKEKNRIRILFISYIFMIVSLMIYEPMVGYWDQVSVTDKQVDKITIEGIPVLIGMSLMPFII